MKKSLVTLIGLLCVLALTVSAADGKKKQPLTDDQKALQKQMLEKYDANKDGKLDETELAAMKAAHDAKGGEHKGGKHEGGKHEGKPAAPAAQ